MSDVATIDRGLADRAAQSAGARTEPCRVKSVVPLPGGVWDEYVREHRDGTFFHLSGWRLAVKSAFGHEDFYLAAMRGERLVGTLPMFLVRSLFGGRLLVSVPYGVGGGILADDPDAAMTLFQAAKRTASNHGCSMIDFRSRSPVVPELPTLEHHAGFSRELPDRSEDVLGWLPRKARAAARNGRNKYGLTVHFGEPHLREVWKLYALSMRRLGSLNYPFSFLKALCEHNASAHWTCLVRREGRTVAGLVTFLFDDTVMPYFIGTTAEATRCSAANFIYLSVMERAAAEGFKTFDFGRSRRDNTGSYDFKRFCGFEPQPLGYQRYVPPGGREPDLSPTNPKFRLARKVWTHLPLSVTRFVGARLSRHLPG